ncbi:MAG: OB-fold domain-containing protein, partial [Chloroflexi bacterium]|nr:OB-fold domain-containing protein [Chloroflexota bacterium]
ELDEGPRMYTNLVDVEPDPKSLRCDMPVEVVFEDISEEISLPRFRPASA